MTDSVEKMKIKDRSGNPVEVDFKLSHFAEAQDRNMTLTQYMNQLYGSVTDVNAYGDVVAQFMLSSGMYTQADDRSGVRPPRMSQIYSGTIAPVGSNISAIVRRDGSDRTLAGRMLFAEIVMRVIESELREDHDDLFGFWNSAIAQVDTVNQPKFEQPIINVKAPEQIRSRPISQLTEPGTMIEITTDSRTHTIPTQSIGLVMSDQAMSATSLDLVNIILAAQSRGERLARALEDINAIVEGDADRGETAKATTTAQSLDSAITTAGTMTHRAYIKYLHRYRRRMQTTHMMMSMDNALAFNQRAGKPTRDTVLTMDPEGMDQTMTIDNLEGQPPRVLVVDDGVIAANKVMGWDRRFALRKVINVAAQYSALEEFVLRRGTAMRFDFGEVTHTLMSDAYNGLTLTV